MPASAARRRTMYQTSVRDIARGPSFFVLPVIFPAKWRKFFTLFGVTLPLTPRGFSAFTVDLTTTVSRALKLDPQSAVERELKPPILCLTHRLATSAPPQSHPNPRPSARLSHFIKLLVH